MRRPLLLLLPFLSVLFAVGASRVAARPMESGERSPIAAAPSAAPPGWAEGRTADVPDRLDDTDPANAYRLPALVEPSPVVDDDGARNDRTAGALDGAQVEATAGGLAEPLPDSPAADLRRIEPAAPAVAATSPPRGSRAELTASASRWIARFEGRRSRAYADQRGNRTVGIGCNLDAGDGAERLAAVRADYDAVRDGEDPLSAAQVQRLFDRDLASAVRAAERLVDDLYAHPPAVQRLVVDLVFTVGPTGFSRFRGAREAVDARDYAALAELLPRTRWYQQNRRRGEAHRDELRDLADAGR